MNELDKAYGEGHAQGLQDGMQMVKNQIDMILNSLGTNLNDICELSRLVRDGTVKIIVDKGSIADNEQCTTIKICRM